VGRLTPARVTPEATLRRHLRRILAAAVKAVDPAAAVRAVVRRAGHELRIGDREYDLARLRRIFIIGGGKADAPMAAALEAILRDRITGGLLSVKYGHAVPLRRVELVEAGHPLPDESGRRAAERMLEIARAAQRDDLVICLISGGGSALLPAPGTLADLRGSVPDNGVPSEVAIANLRAEWDDPNAPSLDDFTHWPFPPEG